MAQSFKEIGKKAEALIEQGKEADRNVQNCQARVAQAHNRVAAARMELDVASETDEDGNPVGDVGYAMAQLSMAENQLAASQRALSSARSDADRVREQKNEHVQEIERHNQVERSNLEKLRRLRSSAFGEDSAALTEGIVRRLNEAEDARVEVLRSMGIDVAPDYVAVGGGGAGSGWRGGGFATLDTAGRAQRYQGGGYETAPEKLDAFNPEISGEYVFADNPYSERWEDFAKEFADESSTNWESLKNVPFMYGNVNGWSEEIVEKIASPEQAHIYGSAGLSETEINNRKCLVKNIDLDYTDPKTGKTNRELMALGRPPFDSATGERVELHHMGQAYDSPFAELCENSEHGDGNDAILHDKKMESWRQDETLKNRYNNVDRPKHWMERLRKIEEDIV